MQTNKPLNPESIDFAIIAALEVERKAIVSQIIEVEKIQPNNEPLTFYKGKIKLSEEEFYTVVVVQLVEMGNVDAGVTTTKLFQYYHPENVLMVGIAGGLKEKVDLGDVVVATHVCYYEPAKLKGKNTENRQKQFHSNTTLLERAKHYEELDWKGNINTKRPEDDGGDERSKSHIGAIACGEKVIEDEKALNNIIKICPKIIAVAMEGAGVATAVANNGMRPRFLEIRGICDYAIPPKKDGWHKYASSAAAAFTVGFLKSRPVTPIRNTESINREKSSATTLIISIQSLRKIEKEEIIPALPLNLQEGEVEYLKLDFSKQVKGKILKDPELAVQKLTSSKSKFQKVLSNQVKANIVFHGLALIPLVVLAGYIVSDRTQVYLYDSHSDSPPGTNPWIWPEKNQEFPQLIEKGMPRKKNEKHGEVLIRMGISYPILPSETLKIIENSIVQIDLSLLSPERKSVRSESQLRSYGERFRSVLDRIRSQIPNCKKIHLFYAGPVSLGFYLGQQISENIHPPVVVWNFSQTYNWGIDLSLAVKGQPSILGLEETTNN